MILILAYPLTLISTYQLYAFYEQFCNHIFNHTHIFYSDSLRFYVQKKKNNILKFGP